jgi:hypothetical protein
MNIQRYARKGFNSSNEPEATPCSFYISYRLLIAFLEGIYIFALLNTFVKSNPKYRKHINSNIVAAPSSKFPIIGI